MTVPAGRKIRVLIVDDHALFRRGLEMVLAAEPGIDVVGARNAGLWPIVMDPFGFQPDADYARVTSLFDVAALIVSG